MQSQIHNKPDLVRSARSGSLAESIRIRIIRSPTARPSSTRAPARTLDGRPANFRPCNPAVRHEDALLRKQRHARQSRTEPMTFFQPSGHAPREPARWLAGRGPGAQHCCPPMHWCISCDKVVPLPTQRYPMLQPARRASCRFDLVTAWTWRLLGIMTRKKVD